MLEGQTWGRPTDQTSLNDFILAGQRKCFSNRSNSVGRGTEVGGDGPFMLEKAIVRARWFRVGKLRQCLNPSTTPNPCPCHTHTTVLLLETRGGAGRKILRKMCVCVCVGEPTDKLATPPPTEALRDSSLYNSWGG